MSDLARPRTAARVVDVDGAVRAVREGDREAFRVVIQAFEAPLRVMMGALMPGTPVDDLVQQAFISAYLRLGDYQPGTDFAAWIRTLGRHIALNERRRVRRRLGLEEELGRSVEDRMAALVEQQLAGLIRAEARRSLRECLDALGEAPRDVIERFYFGGQSTRQIAEHARRPKTWVRVVLFRARAALARCLERKEVAGLG